MTYPIPPNGKLNLKKRAIMKTSALTNPRSYLISALLGAVLSFGLTLSLYNCSVTHPQQYFSESMAWISHQMEDSQESKDDTAIQSNETSGYRVTDHVIDYRFDIYLAAAEARLRQMLDPM